MAGRRVTQRIAFLVDWLQDPYQDAILHGAAQEAAEHGVGLVAFPGGMLDAPGLNGSCRNHLYELVQPSDFHGVIVMSGTMGNFAGVDRLRQFCERYSTVPVCSVGVEVRGTGLVTVDNVSGMRSAIEHLVKVHGHRRIAFIRGPEANAEAEARYAAYRDVLRDNGISLDERLVLPGDFQREGGARAVSTLFGDRKVRAEDLDAIAGAADLMLLGARDELERRRIRLPDQIALVGFDDVEEARWVSPPLSSVRQPLEQQGKAAVGMVLRQMTSGRSEEHVTLQTQLLPRASCGCLLHRSEHESRSTDAKRFGAEAAIIQHRPAILATVTRASQGLFGAAGRGWEESLLNSFSADLRHREDQFIVVLNRQLERVVGSGGDPNVAQAVLSALSDAVLPLGRDGDEVRQMAGLLDAARVLVGTAAERAQARMRLDAEQWIRSLARVSGRLSGTRDLEVLSDVVLEELPRLGLESFYLTRYEDDPATKAELVVAYGPWGSVGPGKTRSFEPTHYVPPAIAGRVPEQIIVEPLFQGNRALGLAGFQVAGFGGFAYEVLRELLSAALSSSAQ